MSFNLRFATVLDGPNAWSRRRELAYALLREERPDVIGFQEVTPGQRRDLEEELTDYASLGEGRNGKGKGEQCAVFWRTDRLTVEHGATFGLHPKGHVGRRAWDAALPRICTYVRFPGLDLFNVHLDHVGRKARLLGLREVVDRVRPGHPTLIMGDFNALETSRSVRYLLREGFQDTFRLTHPSVDQRQGTFHGFQGFVTGPRIDFIFACPQMEVLQARILRHNNEGRFPSDHFPILARVRLAPGAH